MIRSVLFSTLVLVIISAGCSSSPVVPDRQSSGFSEELTFQLAIYLADPSLGDPALIPTNIPIGSLVNTEFIPVTASYTLAAFDVFIDPSAWGIMESDVRAGSRYEPDDWDDWLTSGLYEPDDWDDWLTHVRKPQAANGYLLKDIAMKIDPMSNFEPSDWDDWLVSGQYEPDDWDDWLVTATIADLVSLN